MADSTPSKFYDTNSNTQTFNANSSAESGEVRKPSKSVVRAEGSLFSITAISRHFKELGYPEKRKKLRIGK